MQDHTKLRAFELADEVTKQSSAHSLNNLSSNKNSILFHNGKDVPFYLFLRSQTHQPGYQSAVFE